MDRKRIQELAGIPKELFEKKDSVRRYKEQRKNQFNVTVSPVITESDYQQNMVELHINSINNFCDVNLTYPELIKVGKAIASWKKKHTSAVMEEFAEKELQTGEDETAVLKNAWVNLSEALSTLTNLKGADLDDEADAKHQLTSLLREFIRVELD